MPEMYLVLGVCGVEWRETEAYPCEEEIYLTLMRAVNLRKKTKSFKRKLIFFCYFEALISREL